MHPNIPGSTKECLTDTKIQDKYKKAEILSHQSTVVIARPNIAGRRCLLKIISRHSYQLQAYQLPEEDQFPFDPVHANNLRDVGITNL